MIFCFVQYIQYIICTVYKIKKAISESAAADPDK